jgi:transcriptional regulator with XRE-family HTH domain
MQLEGFTTEDVAKKLKVNRSLISIWQTGRRVIPESRINELVAIFPKYPVYYYNRDLTDDDMAALRNIKVNGKVIAQPTRDERLNRVENVINEMLNEQSKVLSDVADILKINDYASLMKKADTFSDKQILNVLFAVIGSEQERYLHDYRILNGLERQRRNMPAHGGGRFRYILIGIAMSALAVAFGLEDDVASLTDTHSLRSIVPAEMIDNDLGFNNNIKLFNEWRDKIIALFNEIIDCCDNIENELNESNGKR